jgi:catechol 2,3-dioxygenase-like lactoylglutathione lyase family enzyme
MRPVPRLDATGLIVSDVKASVAFYRLLGLDFPDDAEGHVEAALPGGFRVMLDTEETIRSFDPGWSPPAGGHRSSLAFLCDSPSEVDEMYRTLLDAGGRAHKAPWDAFWGQRYALVEDPDGHVVDLFAPLDTAAA